MKISRFLAVATLLAGLLFLLHSPIKSLAQDDNVAQDQDQNQDQDQSPDDDPPGRVARLNYSNGSVSFQPGGDGDWVEAVSNRPLTSGDNLWAEKGARAELHVGSTAIRMNSETSLTFLDLDDHSTQLRLSLGSLLLRVRHLDDGDDFEVDTPNLAFAVQAPGEYRIDVNSDGNETVTTVWHGRGEATGGGYSYDVVAGQQARFDGTDQLDHEIAQISPTDDFSRWAFDRDEREDHAESANYISTEVTGYEDLDDHGSWHYAAGYGTVWTPRGIASDWAPYRYGHWVWVEPWGWTWVEDEPWGFAPFHYGRWAYVQSSWCWVPGPVVVRPVYSPALVAFVGGGGFHVGVAVGGGPVGWFPLGPGEVYVPPYRVSRRYVNNVNVTNTRVNITQVTNVYNVYNSRTNATRITYVNQRTQAVTVVAHDTFINARPVGRNIVRVDEREILQAQVARRVDIRPERASIQGAGRPVQMRPPARVVERQVVATRAPTPSRPTFEQRQAPANVRTEAPGRPAPSREAEGQQRPATQGNQNRGNDNRQQPVARENENSRGPQQPQNQPQPPAQANQNRGNDNRQQPVARENENPRPQPQGQQQPQANQRPGDIRPVPRPPQTEHVQMNAPNNARPNNAQLNNAQPEAQNQQRQEQERQVQNQNRQEAQRPEQNRPDQNAERRQQQAQEQNRRQQMVRQAPPVQDRPQTQQNEEQKFRQWQDQRQRTAQPQNRPAEQHQAAPKPAERGGERPKNDDKKPR